MLRKKIWSILYQELTFVFFYLTCSTQQDVVKLRHLFGHETLGYVWYIVATLYKTVIYNPREQHIHYDKKLPPPFLQIVVCNFTKMANGPIFKPAFGRAVHVN